MELTCHICAISIRKAWLSNFKLEQFEMILSNSVGSLCFKSTDAVIYFD